MGGLVTAIGNVFRFHKMKIAMTLVFAIVFAVLTFPYGDLSGVLPTLIYQKSGNQTYVQFEDMGLNLVPFGISLDEVLIEAAGLPPISASHIDAAPWILGAITGKTGGSVDAQDLFGGIVVADIREGDKAKAGNRFLTAAVDAQGLKLPLVANFVRDAGMANLSLLGALNLSTSMQIDGAFKDQPNGDVEAAFTGLTLPAQVFSQRTPDGYKRDFALPEVKVGNAKLAAKVGGGSINISDLSFGSARDSIAGKIRGSVAMQMLRDQLGTRAQMGVMDLQIDLTMKKSFIDSDATLQLASLYLAKFGREVADGTRFQFRMKFGPGMAMPELSALQ